MKVLLLLSLLAAVSFGCSPGQGTPTCDPCGPGLYSDGTAACLPLAPGFFSTGSAEVASPTTTDCGAETCGPLAAGFFSTGGAKVAAPTSADCGSFLCGPVAAGYFSTGKATTATPLGPTDCNNGNCGILAPGYFSTGAAGIAAPTSAAHCPGKTCGAVSAGYFSSGGGTLAAPVAAGNGCLPGSTCGLIEAGYFSQGGATSRLGSGPVAAGYFSTGGGTTATGGTVGTGGLTAGPIAGGYFSTGGATRSNPDGPGNGCISNRSCGKVALGFYSSGGAKRADPMVSGDDCVGSGATCGQIKAGRFAAARGAISVDGDGAVLAGYFSTGGAFVATGLGQIEAGYFSTGGATKSNPSVAADCPSFTCGLVDAGYFSTRGGTQAAPVEPGNGCLSVGDCGKVSAGSFSSGGGMVKAPRTDADCAGPTTTCGLVGPGRYGNVVGAVDRDGAGIVAGGYYSTGGATTATPTAAGTGCPATMRCGKVKPGFFATGGAHTDSPSDTSCEAGQTCGPIRAGYFASAEGSAVDTGNGPVGAGYYSGPGATSAQGHGLIAAAYFSTAGANKAVPLIAADCSGSCGLLDPGYFSTGGGKVGTPDNTGCIVGQACGKVAAGYFASGGATRSNPTMAAHCPSTTCGVIGAGKYAVAVGAVSADGDGEVAAGFFSTGGATSANPTASDCVGGNQCGQVSRGHFSTMGAKIAAPLSDGDCVGAGATCGVTAAGRYDTRLGSFDPQGEGAVEAGHYSEGGAKVARPLSAGDCAKPCGLVAGGYFSAGGATTRMPAGSKVAVGHWSTDACGAKVAKPSDPRLHCARPLAGYSGACAAGKSSVEGSSLASACVACSGGFFSASGRACVESCAEYAPDVFVSGPGGSCIRQARLVTLALTAGTVSNFASDKTFYVVSAADLAATVGLNVGSTTTNPSDATIRVNGKPKTTVVPTPSGKTTKIVIEVSSPGTASTVYTIHFRSVPRNGVFTGMSHSCVLNNRNIACWGSNGFGQLGTETADDLVGAVTAPVTNVIVSVDSVAVGATNSCVIKNGDLICWGSNENLQVRADPLVTSLGKAAGDSANYMQAFNAAITDTIVQVSVGANVLCGVFSQGGVLCWGQGLPVIGRIPNVDVHVSDVDSFITFSDTIPAVSVSVWRHACAVFANGRTRCWGDNGNQQLGDGTSISKGVAATGTNSVTAAVYVTFAPDINSVPVIDAKAGETHTCVLFENLRVICFGGDSGTNTHYGQNGQCVATSAECLITVAKANYIDFPSVNDLVDKMSVSVGQSCFLFVSGKATCLGQNTAMLRTKSTPYLAFPGDALVADLSVHATHTCGRTVTGSVACYGDDSTGQLGLDSTETKTAPDAPIGATFATAAPKCGNDIVDAGEACDTSAGGCTTCAVDTGYICSTKTSPSQCFAFDGSGCATTTGLDPDLASAKACRTL